jgi:hydrogenase maturation protease
VTKVLLIGYGNPGRLDDGLGPAVAAEIEKLNIDGIDCDSDYQLTVEDAVDIHEHDVVIFADADVSCTTPFYFKKIEAGKSVSFSSHSINPKSLLALTKQIYDTETNAFVLGIRGFEFNEFEERLSEHAKSNLKQALEFIIPVLKEKNFKDFVPEIDV